MNVEEIEAAISQLPAGEVAELMVRLRQIYAQAWEKIKTWNDGSGDPTSPGRFNRLAADWKSQGKFVASPTAIADLPSYRAIIAMGRPALPLILGALRREPDHWFVALRRITGEDPVPEAALGDLLRMAEAWLRWGAEHGIDA